MLSSPTALAAHMPERRFRTGAQHLVDALIAQGVTHVFGVPGESYLAVLDALWDAREAIRFITCRHEAAAANMADAWGKLTGRPGIAFVTRGPGATHAAIGVHTAFQDSTPMILFIGQVARDQRDREAFQEIDYNRMFSGVAKHAEQIDRTERVPEYIARAFATATAGRPGPVVIALPEDMLTETAEAAPIRAVEPAAAAPAPAALARLAALLKSARKPLLIAGGSTWTAQAVADLSLLAERWQIPVATSFRAKDLIDNRHSHYAGDVGIGPNPRLAARVREADLLVVLGARLGEMTTSGYTLLEAPTPSQSLVHIHPSGEELGRVFHPVVAMQASMPEAVAALLQLEAPGWPDCVRAAHDAYLDWIKPVAVSGPVNLSELWHKVDARLPADAILCNGAGNYAGWLHRFYQHKAWKTQLAPTSGAMGYGLPAAIAAAFAHPERTILAVHGDGCFLMAGNELATLAHYGLKVIVLVCDNGSYGTIRMHQERDYPGRTSGTDLANPDFAAYARAFGIGGLTVERTEDFAAAFDQAMAASGSTLIHIKTAVRDIAPGRILPLQG